jgi:hypothetical protein
VYSQRHSLRSSFVNTNTSIPKLEISVRSGISSGSNAKKAFDHGRQIWKAFIQLIMGHGSFKPLHISVRHCVAFKCSLLAL